MMTLASIGKRQNVYLTAKSPSSGNTRPNKTHLEAIQTYPPPSVIARLTSRRPSTQKNHNNPTSKINIDLKSPMLPYDWMNQEGPISAVVSRQGSPYKNKLEDCRIGLHLPLSSIQLRRERIPMSCPEPMPSFTRVPVLLS